MVSFEELFGQHRIMVILRGLPTPAETVAAAERAWDAGVELLEVPIGEPDQVASLAAVAQAGAQRGKLVGAGTVITTQQVRAAADAGARYTAVEMTMQAARPPTISMTRCRRLLLLGFVTSLLAACTAGSDEPIEVETPRLS